MSSTVPNVNEETIKSCMKCSICEEVYKEATTITVCLHTFCKICIHEKISEEDNPCCPVCKADLGCMPEEKLRPDHSWRNIAAKLFPPQGSKVETPEVTPSNSPAVTRKGPSSSLVESSPRVSLQKGKTGRKKDSGVRKVSAASSAIPATEETPKRVEDSMEEHLDGPSSPRPLNNIMQNKNQNSSDRSSNNQTCDELMEDKSEGLEGKVVSGKPLNTLIESSNKSKFSKAHMEGLSHVKAVGSDSGDIDMNMKRIEDDEQKAEVQVEKSSMPSVPGTVKCKRRRPKKDRSSAPSETSSSKVIVNENLQNWKDGPIWFSLVALENQVGCEPLPQVSSAYMSIKDLSMTVSTIQKYLAEKLDLASETEVEIMCLGEPLVPDLKLSSVLEAWINASSPQKKVQVSISDSAEDFVMVLSYARRVAASTT